MLLPQTLAGSYAPLLSPPSRSFHTQLRYADFSSSLLQQQQMASMDSLHGVMPLLQVGRHALHQGVSAVKLLLVVDVGALVKSCRLCWLAWQCHPLRCLQ